MDITLPVLDRFDPIYPLLAEAIREVSTCQIEAPCEFQVEDIVGDRTVMKYTEVRACVSVVVKYYGNKWIFGHQSGDRALRAELMAREYNNLQVARSLGLTGPPHRVVRPLAISEARNCALVLDFAPGDDLDVRIREAVESRDTTRISVGVRAVARFLADMHNLSAAEPSADQSNVAIDYLAAITRQLVRWQIMSAETAEEIVAIGSQWQQSGGLDSPRSALTHGDATPKHFRFAADDDLTVIDFERLRRSDPVADLGRMAAELKHLFYYYSGDAWSSEPFIDELYREYTDRSGGAAESFSALTERGRFYMACDELRISRNHWLDMRYRQALIREARACIAV